MRDEWLLEDYHFTHCAGVVVLTFLLQGERIMLMMEIIEKELVKELAPSFFFSTFVGRMGGTVDDVVNLIK